MNILYIMTRPPFPVTTGDRVLIYNRLIRLHKKHDISLVIFYQKSQELEDMKEIYGYCKKIWTFKRSRITSMFGVLINFLFSYDPIQVLFYKSRNINRKIEKIMKDNDFDIVNVFLIRGLPYVCNSTVPVILDMVDSMQLNFSRRHDNADNFFEKKIYSLELERVVKYEKNLPESVVKTLFVAKKDGMKITSKKQVIPLGVDTNKFFPSFKKNKKTIIFTGNMSYSPNIQAVKWFLDNCFNKICEKVDGTVVFIIAGINPTREILRYQADNIIITGYVDSLSELISHSAISIAPMQSGSGMQNKILEAMSCAIPVVTTTLGLGSIEAKHMREVVVEDNPIQFAYVVSDILNFPDKYSVLSESARNLVIKKYSWKLHVSTIEDVYSKAVAGIT
jgi:polysaccharide biosynthesis protein PslH